MTASGEVLWTPGEEWVRATRIHDYLGWLRERGHGDFPGFAALHAWSIEDLDRFWRTIWEYFEIQADGSWERALAEARMPGAEWFPGARLSFVEHVFRAARPDRPAILARSESEARRELSWAELRARVASVAAWLREQGVGPGDRVVGYLPNTPETVIAFLAAASLGAIWSCCSPDFGTKSVIDRFRQISPKVLFATAGYGYGGARYDRLAVVAELEARLSSLERVVLVGEGGREGWSRWEEVSSRQAGLELPRLPFSHPLWIVYTSGTTGLPKPIVHSQGGVLLEMLKGSALHLDVRSGDVLFWYSSTGWIMWNLVACGLLTGATIVLYDGNPAHPDQDALWRLADEFGLTHLGTSAAFLQSCLKAGLDPGPRHDLSALRAVGSTGSPLSPDAFGWVYEHVKRDLWLPSISGGTDVATAFVGGCPILPVNAGEIQCRYLGTDARALDPQGRDVPAGAIGELVVAQPMPSMPVRFWNDEGDRRYLDSYFGTYPGLWRHGDFISFTERGSAIIYGRSDSTINRGGIRMGTSEIYEVVEALPEVADSLAVEVGDGRERTRMLLFVTLREGVELDEGLVERVKAALRTQLSPRHVPDQVIDAPAIPRTLNGKKLEVPVKRLLMGVDAPDAVSRDATANPDSLDFFLGLAGRSRH